MSTAAGIDFGMSDQQISSGARRPRRPRAIAPPSGRAGDRGGGPRPGRGAGRGPLRRDRPGTPSHPASRRRQPRAVAGRRCLGGAPGCPGSADRAADVWFHGCIRPAHGAHPHAVRHRFTRSPSVPLDGAWQRQGELLSLPLSTYSALGGLPQGPGDHAESRADATTGSGCATCVCPCRCVGGAGTSDQCWVR